MTPKLTRFLLDDSLGLTVGRRLIGHLVLDGLEVLTVKLSEVHEHEFVVRLIAEQDLDVLFTHRLHVGRHLR